MIKQGGISKLLRDSIIIKMATENAVTVMKSSKLSIEILQSEQSLYENEFSYRCL